MIHSDVFNPSLFLSRSFKVTSVIFANIFEVIFYFAVIIDPFQMSFKRLTFETLSVELKNEIYGNNMF